MTLKTEEVMVNIGPQHPSTHGVFRMRVTFDGEVVTDLEPVFGYLHRGTEKLAEERTYTQVITLTDRLDYVSSMSNNLAYVLATEKLSGIQPPERAMYQHSFYGRLAESRRVESVPLDKLLRQAVPYLNDCVLLCGDGRLRDPAPDIHYLVYGRWWRSMVSVRRRPAGRKRDKQGQGQEEQGSGFSECSSTHIRPSPRLYINLNTSGLSRSWVRRPLHTSGVSL